MKITIGCLVVVCVLAIAGIGIAYETGDMTAIRLWQQTIMNICMIVLTCMIVGFMGMSRTTVEKTVDKKEEIDEPNFPKTM